MPKHILLVCQSCNLSDEKQDLSDGSRLLNQLQQLHQDCSRQAELEIQAVGCLWVCQHPCAVALSGSHKSTYLFTNLPLLESATALLQFAELYLDSEDGAIPWKQFPNVLKTDLVAQIPPGKGLKNEN